MEYRERQSDTSFKESAGSKCGRNEEVMWCYCGKCENEDYPLPKDFARAKAPIWLTENGHYAETTISSDQETS